MKIKKDAYSSAETVYILRRELGPLREWSYFLADCRADRTANIAGLVLLPHGIKRDGRSWRPLYRADDVTAFVAAVRAKCCDARPNQAPRPITVTLDTTDTRPWQVRKIEARRLPYAIIY